MSKAIFELFRKLAWTVETDLFQPFLHSPMPSFKLFRELVVCGHSGSISRS